jgi:prepilin-type N-terminal cleavage/methylation domain-containing protein/prepilin-type processing-associated H-X9-DG protein
MICKRRLAPGFTLIELLVVISIIAVLMSVMMPALSKARSLAQSAVCKSQMKDIGLAFNMYVEDNNRKVINTAGSTATAGGRWMQKLSDYMYQRRSNTGSDVGGSASEGGIYDFELFRCPIENRKAKKAGFDGDGRSVMGAWGVYGYNQFFTGYVFGGNSYSVIPNNTKEDNAWRMFDQIMMPGTLPLFADTNTDDPMGLGVRGAWWLSAKAPHPNAYFEENWNGGATNARKKMSELAPMGPAANHGSKTNYLMADGHVESMGIWPWRDFLGTDFHPKRNVEVKPSAPPADYWN